MSPASSRLLRVVLAVGWLAIAGLWLACGRSTASDLSGPAPSVSDPGTLAILPERAEAVALADALAVSAMQVGGEEGGRLLRRAADVRTRLWRLDHRETDGLEALELLREIESIGGTDGCRAAVDTALLQAELRRDPAEAYRTAYLARARSNDADCGARADTVLSALVAFRPLPNVLTELDRQLGRDQTTDVGVGADGGAANDAGARVVVPNLDLSQKRAVVRLTGVQRYGAQEDARIVVLLSHPAVFEVGYLPRENAERGPRLYVDIRQAQYQGKLSFEVGGLVQRVRLGRQPGKTRVVLDLERDAHHKVFYLPEPFRLVIDVSTEPAEPAPVQPGVRRPVRRVVLDPGHGGHDPGALGPGGLAEKDVTLDIAHRAAPLIARELGIATLLTRDADVYVPLDERAARANAFQADLFISIHCNASEDHERRGVMTFVLDESADAWASSIAARENAASAAAAAEVAAVLGRVQDSAKVARCVQFADLLQRAAVASLHDGYSDVPDRGVRRGGFYVLAGARMPAVLFEVSFISHPTGEMRLNTADYRQKLADAIVNAIRAYRDGR